MNDSLSLDALRTHAQKNASLARHRRRTATALAAAALIGVSMTACSSGGNDADAAGTDSTVVDSSSSAGTVTDTDGTITAGDATDSAPQFSPSGGPGMGPGGQGGPGGRGGEVTAIDGSTVTVENQGRDGTTTTLTVETSDDTTVTATRQGSIDDLAVGDAIVAFGETNDDAFVASTINEGMGAMGGPVFQGGGMPGGPGSGDGRPPVFSDGAAPDGSIPEPPADFPTSGRAGGPGGGAAGAPMAGQLVSGTITEIGDSTITVETNDGVETVINVDDDTAVTVAVEKELGDIKVGSTIRVSGDLTDDTIAATSIIVSED